MTSRGQKGSWSELFSATIGPKEGAKNGETTEDNGQAMKRKPYEKELRKLQAELCWLQEWGQAQGIANRHLV